MEIQVLQGINLENDITTIKITLDASPESVLALLDQINEYHPIFMRSYSVDGNTISILSKLPHVWKESAQYFNQLALGDIDYEKAHERVVTHVINSQVKSMSTIPILYAAHQKGLETTQTFVSHGVDLYPTSGKGSLINRYYTIGVGQKSAITVSAASSGDSHIAQKTQKDKWNTNNAVDRLRLPNAPWEVIKSEDDLEEILSRYEGKVVIKPVGLMGGSGVTTNITTLEHAKKAYRYAQEKINLKDRPTWQTKIMIQKQVEGEDYRLLVIDGVLRVATKRIPAFVVGDGTSSIRELIEETNKDPRRDIKNPAHTLKPIQFDEMLDEYIEEQDLTLEYVPKKDEEIHVRKVASMSQGGITEDFTDKVHPQIKYLCESLASSLHAFVYGIDILCVDISKPLTIENGSFIEMN